MKKRIILLILISMLFGGIVSASGLWGEYKGNSIVRLTSGGKDLSSSDVPAISYQGRTMVPIYMLRQLGAEVTWDENTFTADVKLPNTTTLLGNVSSVTDVIKHAKDFKSQDIGYVEFVSNGDQFHQLTFYYDKTLEALFLKNALFDSLLTVSSQTEATSTRIVDIYGGELTVLTDYIRDFKSGLISAKDLESKYHISPAITPGSSTNETYLDTTPDVVESKIESDFDGFENGNIYELSNGQFWKQVDYTYEYEYEFRPDVLIYKEGSYYYMDVENCEKHPRVELIK